MSDPNQPADEKLPSYPPPPPAPFENTEPDVAPAGPPARPGSVLAGCIMAWVGGALGIVLGSFLATVSEDSDLLVDNFDDPGDAASVMHLVGAVYIVWCIAVVVVAVFAFKGRKWAAITLLVMAIVMMVVTIIGLVSGNGQSVLAGVWAVLSAVLVYRLKSSKEWFDRMSQQPV